MNKQVLRILEIVFPFSFSMECMVKRINLRQSNKSCKNNNDNGKNLFSFLYSTTSILKTVNSITGENDGLMVIHSFFIQKLHPLKITVSDYSLFLFICPEFTTILWP